jgi:hypothetical protein
MPIAGLAWRVAGLEGRRRRPRPLIAGSERPGLLGHLLPDLTALCSATGAAVVVTAEPLRQPGEWSVQPVAAQGGNRPRPHLAIP